MALHESTSLIAPTSSVTTHISPWHSPVPYLFGGLAAMSGLIAFALLILACSYWNLSRNLQNDNEGERDLEAGDVKPDNHNTDTTLIVCEEKYLVIMAGQKNPTFLATPSSSRTSSFGSSSCRSCSTTTTENEKDESSDQVQASIIGSHESVDQVS